jgi:hypothetical protein
MQEDGIAMAAAVSVDGGDDRARHTRKGFFAARSRSRMTGWCGVAWADCWAVFSTANNKKFLIYVLLGYWS